MTCMARYCTHSLIKKIGTGGGSGTGGGGEERAGRGIPGVAGTGRN